MSRTKASEVVHRWRLFWCLLTGQLRTRWETLCCAFRNFQWKRAKFKKYSGAKSPNYAGWELLFKWNFEVFLLDMKLLSFKRKIMCCRLSARLLYILLFLCAQLNQRLCVFFNHFAPLLFSKMQFSLYKYRIVKLSGDRPKTYLATGLYNWYTFYWKYCKFVWKDKM